MFNQNNEKEKKQEPQKTTTTKPKKKEIPGKTMTLQYLRNSRERIDNTKKLED
jgi:hypothetical protein